MSKLLIYYAACDCHAWPVIPGYPMGSCGRCHTRPETMRKNRIEAEVDLERRKELADD